MDWSQVTTALDLGPAANILNWAIGIGSVIALGVIVYGGILYTASGMNPSLKENAKDWIKAACWGLLILFAAYLILNTINPLFVGGSY